MSIQYQWEKVFEQKIFGYPYMQHNPNASGRNIHLNTNMKSAAISLGVCEQPAGAADCCIVPSDEEQHCTVWRAWLISQWFSCCFPRVFFFFSEAFPQLAEGPLHPVSLQNSATRWSCCRNQEVEPLETMQNCSFSKE